MIDINPRTGTIKLGDIRMVLVSVEAQGYLRRDVSEVIFGLGGESTVLTIDPSLITKRENYKILTGSIIPRPIAFVTTLSEEGVLNGAPFSYFNIVSDNPPLISVSVQRKANHMKDTARNIHHTKEYVVHITDTSNVEKINTTSGNYPADQSEVELTGMTPVQSTIISVPGVREAKIRFECKLEQALEFQSSDQQTSCDLFIGRVVCYHINEEVYEEGKISASKLQPVCRLAGNNYAKLGDEFVLKRPE